MLVLGLKVTKIMLNSLAIRDIIIVRFPCQNPQGREQEGIRPALIVGFPQAIGNPRYPLILVAPLTTNRLQSWAINSPNLYPQLSIGVANLPQNSLILLDQIRAIDLNRVVRYLGTLKIEQYQPILDHLKIIFNLQIT